MTEKEKMLKEMLYDANNNDVLLKKEQSQKIYVSNLIN